MSRYFIYCRKSTEAEDRQILSLDSQRSELEAMASRLNLDVAEVLTEARSAKSPGRPVFGTMLRRLARGDAQGILCWKLDRLARNPKDGGDLLWAMKAQALEIITPTQTFGPNDDNKILVYIEFGMAEKYIDDLSRNVKRGNRAKLERGGWPNYAPQGYLNDRLTKTILTDTVRFPVLRQAWDLLLSGRSSVLQIWRTLNQDWGYRTRRGFPIALSSLHTIFRNAFYSGLMESKDGSFRGNHQPMITEAEFWRAQEILGRRGKRRPQRYRFAYTGLIRCGECGCMITAEHKVNRHGYRYIYYHCTRKRPCTERVIEVKALEAQIATYLSSLAIQPRILDWAYDQLQHAEQADQSARASVETNLRTSLDHARKQLGVLTQLRTRTLITDQEFIQERRRLQAEIAGLEAQLAGEDTVSASAAAFDALLFAARAHDCFLAGDSDTKRHIIESVGSNLVLKDKNLSVEAKIPFRVIHDGLATLRTAPEPIEPSNTRLTMRDLLGLDAHKNRLCALVHDVRTSLLEHPLPEAVGRLVKMFLGRTDESYDEGVS